MVEMCDRRETISKKQGRPLHNTTIFPRIQEKQCCIWAASDDKRTLLSEALDVVTKREYCEILKKAFSRVTVVPSVLFHIRILVFQRLHFVHAQHIYLFTGTHNKCVLSSLCVTLGFIGWSLIL